MTTEAKPAEPRARTMQPNALGKLYNRYGSYTAVAEVLGVSPQHVGQCIKSDAAPIQLELAAHHILSCLENNDDSKAVAVISVPAIDRKMIEAMLTRLGLTFTIIDL